MLAIVIPYFKISYFEETLQSLANQTDKRFKVYIGNDASPDDPSQLIKKYENDLVIVYHEFKNNLGGISLTKQWERCISLTDNEEWLMMLGDDDYLGKNVIEEWYKHFPVFNLNSNVIRFSSKLIYQKNVNNSELYKHPVWEDATKSFLRKYKDLTRSSLSEYIFNRESYEKYGFFDFPLGWNSDDRAWLEFSDNKPIYTINNATIYIRLSNINISGKSDNSDLKRKSTIEFYKFIIKNKLTNYKHPERIRFLRKYEEEIKSIRKPTFNEWTLLSYYYFKYFDYYNFKKFLKRLGKSVINYG